MVAAFDVYLSHITRMARTHKTHFIQACDFQLDLITTYTVEETILNVITGDEIIIVFISDIYSRQVIYASFKN